MKTTETAFNRIMNSELFLIDGEKIDLCEAIIELCDAIQADEETNWHLGECGACCLADFLPGAYWALAEWHAGQASDSYAALCAIGSIFSPGRCSNTPEEDDSEWPAYEAVCQWFESRNA